MIRCPKCGSTDRFIVTALSNVEVDGSTHCVENHDGFEWEGNAPCVCDNCYHEGYYCDFWQSESGGSNG